MENAGDDLGGDVVQLAVVAARKPAQLLERRGHVDVVVAGQGALGLLDDHTAVKRVLQLLGEQLG